MSDKEYLINMPTYLLPIETGNNFTTPDTFAVYLSGQVPTFIPSMLFAFFMIIFMGGILTNKRQTGTNDYAQWAAVAGFGTFVLAGTLFLVPGLISLSTLIVTFSWAFACAIWFFATNDRQ